MNSTPDLDQSSASAVVKQDSIASYAAFVGYTPKPTQQVYTAYFEPVLVHSFAEFQLAFGLSDWPQQAHYYIIPSNNSGKSSYNFSFNNYQFDAVPDPRTVYYLYNSLQLFFQNGGTAAYVVSTGSYGSPSGKPIEADEAIRNEDIKLAELRKGFATLTTIPGIIIYCCPDATLLSKTDYECIVRELLEQAAQQKFCITLLDVPGGNDANSDRFTNYLSDFRMAIGNQHLQFSAAYYPFLKTVCIKKGMINYANLFGGEVTHLKDLLHNLAQNENISHPLLDAPFPDHDDVTTISNHSLLEINFSIYKTVTQQLLAIANIQPASGAVAGLLMRIDKQDGPWTAPANLNLAGAVSLPINVTPEQLQQLNSTTTAGLAINAIRNYVGRGVLVWGAQTLTTASDEQRYLQVRRTVLHIERIGMNLLKSFAKASNDATTHQLLIADFTTFLSDLYKKGALLGASADASFKLRLNEVEFNSTPLLKENNCLLRIEVSLVHPNEFVVIELQGAIGVEL